MNDLDQTPVRLIQLGIERLEEAVRLERAAHPTPWSEELLRSEFTKDISLRPALLLGEELIAQSFNYLVADELHILNIAVAPQFRRQGYAKLLLSNILEMAVKRGCCFSTLEVRASNLAAQRLYRQFGFLQAGVRAKYYKDNSEDALIFERSL